LFLKNNIQLKSGKAEVKELVILVGACIVIHNLCISYNEDPTPKEWYEEIAEDIDWSLFNEDKERISGINMEGGCRRENVFQLFLTHYC
jgi:hypothetical protein